ncbi:MAG: hypothetical protein DWQ34_13540 [Planctomycetota bacterium]|nr:MAG: hypothetical protein DWQ29_14570 [Planctomycetota bacterium]REJ92246.1 MAG: hypothetical protein DWQ34_13540 [Planctomycetota bacterium]REK27353.1 MAG: hypothetical protein DWQ41_08300 [Planctomycetota bacterium]REK36625.1 MAG: hypothetical protein DWQ45_08330 [Planctomycetota bacterium]
MDGHPSPFHASISLGTWFGTRVRISLWFPIVALILCVNLKDLRLGLIVTLLLFAIVIIHEFFHVFAARWTGGSADEILMWPAGGLARTRPADTFRSEFLTAAAGPFSNLLFCLALTPAVSAAGWPPGVFHPFELAAVSVEETVVSDLAVLAFDLNWLLLLVNLLPVYPLDGGQMLLAVLARRGDRETARFTALRIGMAVGIVGAVLGLVFDAVWLVFLGFLVFSMDMYEFFMVQLSDQYDDSFLGYDFSQGYTSLERTEEGGASGHRPGPIRRWKERREEKRRLRAEQERVETEQRVDALLDKVHREGMGSLSDEERRFLEKASGRYRSQDRQ